MSGIPNSDIDLIIGLFKEIEANSSFKKFHFVTPPKSLPSANGLPMGWRLEFKSNSNLFYEFNFKTTTVIETYFFPNRSLQEHRNKIQLLKAAVLPKLAKHVLAWLSYIDKQQKSEIEFEFYFGSDHTPIDDFPKDESDNEYLTPQQLDKVKLLLENIESNVGTNPNIPEAGKNAFYKLISELKEEILKSPTKLIAKKLIYGSKILIEHYCAGVVLHGLQDWAEAALNFVFGLKDLFPPFLAK